MDSHWCTGLARVGLPVREAPDEFGGLGGDTSALSTPAPRAGREDLGSSGHTELFLKSCLAFCPAQWHGGTCSAPASPARAPDSSGCL